MARWKALADSIAKDPVCHRRHSLVAGRIDAEADTTAFAAAVSLTALAGGADDAQRSAEHWLEEAERRLARAAGGR